MIRISRSIAMVLATVSTSMAFTAPTLAQQALPPQLTQAPASDVPPAVQVLRWHMNDGHVNALTFRTMDTLFTTRSVPRSGPVWQLPRSDRALDFSYEFRGQRYTADQFLERTYTNALLVMKDGKIVSEIYRNNTDERTRFMGWSMTKSITSILIGRALEQGLIKSINDPITQYLPELKGSGYEGVSIKHILEMRSGVDYEERYDFANPGVAATNHINTLVKNTARFVDSARTLKRIHEPGKVFAYKTIDTAVLGWLLERVSGDTIAGYTTKHLWEPLGAEADGFYIMDGPPGVGREFNGAGFNATLRDYARIGLMMLNNGNANGKQIVPLKWAAESVRPTDPSAAGPMGYGYQWWTMGGASYTALGLQGQYIYVDRTSRTVVVKLSYFPPAEEAPSEETAAFLKAASAWTPR